ncbi:MAG: class IV adenylate cyclase [Pirellulales bacterium]|nr:class IV adenylate cyclase [Pirellulales bacterium]
MKYEAEQKFPVDNLQDVESRLGELGAEVTGERIEVDRYFNHPARDFAETDEAFRIRRVGPVNKITYKGPRVDETTKTRQELELPLAEGDQSAADWIKLLEKLDFRTVSEVHKRRRKSHVEWQDRTVEVSLDEVTGLGTFVELELVVDEQDLDLARDCIADLAKKLGLKHSERRSYLCLLLEKG